jgi:hypothetical protein
MVVTIERIWKDSQSEHTYFHEKQTYFYGFAMDFEGSGKRSPSMSLPSSSYFIINSDHDTDNNRSVLEESQRILR